MNDDILTQVAALQKRVAELEVDRDAALARAKDAEMEMHEVLSGRAKCYAQLKAAEKRMAELEAEAATLRAALEALRLTARGHAPEEVSITFCCEACEQAHDQAQNALANATLAAEHLERDEAMRHVADAARVVLACLDEEHLYEQEALRTAREELRQALHALKEGS